MEMTPPPMPPTVLPAPDLAVWGQVPTVEIVDRIAALADPMIRNLQITQSYCELSQASASSSAAALTGAPSPPGLRNRQA